ncbi:hypothetical protein C404_29370 [Ralstonia sp. AU12-08]|nr:hypothetical protein C404_29370 [Ralstonia sp. AU12-08]
MFLEQVIDQAKVNFQLGLGFVQVRCHAFLGFLGSCFGCLNHRGHACENRLRLLQYLGNEGGLALSCRLA